MGLFFGRIIHFTHTLLRFQIPYCLILAHEFVKQNGWKLSFEEERLIQQNRFIRIVNVHPDLNFADAGDW